jgi:hypothetical protein
MRGVGIEKYEGRSIFLMRVGIGEDLSVEATRGKNKQEEEGRQE